MTEETETPELTEEQIAQQQDFQQNIATMKIGIAKSMMPRLYRLKPDLAAKTAYNFADAFIDETMKRT